MDSQSHGLLQGILEIYNSLFVDTRSYLLAIIFFALGNLYRVITDRHFRKSYHKELQHFRELVSSDHLVTSIPKTTATTDKKQTHTSNATLSTKIERMIRHVVLFKIAEI